MPRIRIPLVSRIRHPDPLGPIRLHLRAALDIEIEIAPGFFQVVPVFLDTGASYSVMSAATAQEHYLPVPRATSRMNFSTAAGGQSTRVSDAEYVVRFPQFPDHPFPLLWLVQHDLPAGVPPVLGLHNFIDFARVTVDGAYTQSAPMGHLFIEIPPPG